jgi:Nucleotidyltransferase of unknown function (DUF6036)
LITFLMRVFDPVLREPWNAFFEEFDGALSESLSLYCCGGFALTEVYKTTPRSTIDIDFIGAVPSISSFEPDILKLASKGSAMHERHKVYLEHVTVIQYPPEDYESRCIPVSKGRWRFLKLFVLEPHDLALSKLERNSQRDRNDVLSLWKAGLLNCDTLKNRYDLEVRPYIADGLLSWHDTTLKLWLEMFGETQVTS